MWNLNLVKDRKNRHCQTLFLWSTHPQDSFRRWNTKLLYQTSCTRRKQWNRKTWRKRKWSHRGNSKDGYTIKWAAGSKKHTFWLKLTCASAQCNHLCCPHEGTLHSCVSKLRLVKILIRLRECAGRSKSSPGAHVRRYVFGRCGSIINHEIVCGVWDIILTHWQILKILNHLQIKALTALVDRLSLSVGWESGTEWLCNSRNLSEQCRLWSDAAFCGVWSGSELFANAPVQVLQMTLFTQHSDVTATKIARL